MPKIQKKKSSNVLKFSFTETLIQHVMLGYCEKRWQNNIYKNYTIGSKVQEILGVDCSLIIQKSNTN